MRVLILGCGYVGIALGRRLVAAGHQVFGLRRTLQAAEELQPHGIQLLLGDVSDPESLAALPGEFDWVANTVSSSRGDASVYRRVYWQGTRNVLPWLRERGCRRYVYTSSTSVYGQTDGSTVTEDSLTEPRTETAQALLATEREIQFPDSPLACAAGIFRVAGIYGPTRGHLYQQFLRGEARLTGDGSRLINMIHRDDVASALQAFLAAPDLPDGARLYNAADDATVSQREFFEWMSRRLQLPYPPVANAREAAENKRGLTQKRVCNLRLRTELHWKPMYPTFREGYETLISEIP